MPAYADVDHPAASFSCSPLAIEFPAAVIVSSFCCLACAAPLNPQPISPVTLTSPLADLGTCPVFFDGLWPPSAGCRTCGADQVPCHLARASHAQLLPLSARPPPQKRQRCTPRYVCRCNQGGAAGQFVCLEPRNQYDCEAIGGCLGALVWRYENVRL